MSPSHPAIHPRNERVLVRKVEPASAVILASIDSNATVSSDGYIECVEAAPDCKHGPYPPGARLLVLPGANIMTPKGASDYGILHETSIVAIDERPLATTAEPALAVVQQPGSN